MGKAIRCISLDGTLTVMAVNSTDIVEKAQQIHKTSAVCSAALGRLLTAASLMGMVLKGRDDSVTLRLRGDGPAGTVMGVSDSSGNVRGYVQQSVVEIPLNEKGDFNPVRKSMSWAVCWSNLPEHRRIIWISDNTIKNGMNWSDLLIRHCN